MRGRKPVPSAIRRLAGNPGHRAIPDELPAPSGAPEIPDYLSAEARKEWARITDELSDLGILSRVDRAAIGLYCQAWERWRVAESALETEGLVIKAPSGYPVPNPYIAIANKALAAMKSLLVEFGLTPSSRTRLHVTETRNDEDDEFAHLAREIAEEQRKI